MYVEIGVDKRLEFITKLTVIFPGAECNGEFTALYVCILFLFTFLGGNIPCLWDNTGTLQGLFGDYVNWVLKALQNVPDRYLRAHYMLTLWP